jgi:hypothetical protein
MYSKIMKLKTSATVFFIWGLTLSTVLGQIKPKVIEYRPYSGDLKIAFVNISDSSYLIYKPEFLKSLLLNQNDSTLFGIENNEYFHSEPHLYYVDSTGRSKPECCDDTKNFIILNPKDSIYFDLPLKKSINKTGFPLKLHIRLTKDRVPFVTGCYSKYKLWYIEKPLVFNLNINDF